MERGGEDGRGDSKEDNDVSSNTGKDNNSTKMLSSN
jgi:hypothetical protein